MTARERKRHVRLLFVSSDSFPPTRVDVSVLFGQELAGRGHHIDWILQSEAPCLRPYVTRWGGGRAWVGATDPGAALFNRMRKHVRSIANDFRLVPRIRSRDYDAVLVKDKFLAGAIAAIASRWFNIRFIYWLSYPFPESYLLRGKDPMARYRFLYTLRGLTFKWLLYRLLLPAADHIFLQSEQMRRDVEAQGIAPAKLSAVPMGVSTEMLAAMEGTGLRRTLPECVPCIVYLGTMIKERRLDFLIRVHAIVRRSVPGALLYFVGRGEEPADEEFVASEVRRLGLQDAVTFVGQLPQGQALRYVVEADVCVSPFHPTPILLSASPTKLIEYMALGKAVVGNDHPEQKRLIEQSDGGLCVAYDEGAFAAAVVTLLQNPQMARLMGERGRRYAVQHRSYAVIADRVEQRMLEIVNLPC